MPKKIRVLTYGTFDLLHRGHIRILRRAKQLGAVLYVGVSTDSFNRVKGKQSVQSYRDRKLIVESLRYVDTVIPERNWQQKEKDIKKYAIDVFVIGNDWRGKFDHLRSYCRVIYLPRTRNISSTEIKAKVRK